MTVVPVRKGLRWVTVASLGMALLGTMGPTLAAGYPAAAGGRPVSRLLLGRGERVLIIAPHPDDESLATAGVIQAVHQRGGSVRILMMTSGDGFRVAAERSAGKVRLGSQDFLHLGQQRRRETERAMAVLGVRPEEITFLGYPDRGLSRLWSAHWNTDQPYTSGYTGVRAVPYRDAWDPAALYTGEALIGQLRAVLREAQPDRIFVPAAWDRHPDHWATGLFVAYALAESQAAGEPYAAKARLYTYVIHSPGWPSPLGLYFRSARRPALPNVGAGPWVRLELSPLQRLAKGRAIETYHSQVAVIGRFLRAFNRSEEYFQELPAHPLPRLAKAATGQFTVGTADDWMAPLVEDRRPAGQVRTAPGLDLERLSGAVDADDLHLLVRFRGPVSGPVSLRFELSRAGIGPALQPRREGVVLLSGRSGRRLKVINITIPAGAGEDQVHPAPWRARWSVAGDAVLLSVPRDVAGGSGTLFVRVRALQKGREVDALPWVFGVLDQVGREGIR